MRPAQQIEESMPLINDYIVGCNKGFAVVSQEQIDRAHTLFSLIKKNNTLFEKFTISQDIVMKEFVNASISRNIGEFLKFDTDRFREQDKIVAFENFIDMCAYLIIKGKVTKQDVRSYSDNLLCTTIPGDTLFSGTIIGGFNNFIIRIKDDSAKAGNIARVLMLGKIFGHNELCENLLSNLFDSKIDGGNYQSLSLFLSNLSNSLKSLKIAVGNGKEDLQIDEIFDPLVKEVNSYKQKIAEIQKIPAGGIERALGLINIFNKKLPDKIKTRVVTILNSLEIDSIINHLNGNDSPLFELFSLLNTEKKQSIFNKLEILPNHHKVFKGFAFKGETMNKEQKKIKVLEIFKGLLDTVDVSREKPIPSITPEEKAEAERLKQFFAAQGIDLAKRIELLKSQPSKSQYLISCETIATIFVDGKLLMKGSIKDYESELLKNILLSLVSAIKDQNVAGKIQQYLANSSNSTNEDFVIAKMIEIENILCHESTKAHLTSFAQSTDNIIKEIFGAFWGFIDRDLLKLEDPNYRPLNNRELDIFKLILAFNGINGFDMDGKIKNLFSSLESKLQIAIDHQQKMAELLVFAITSSSDQKIIIPDISRMIITWIKKAQNSAQTQNNAFKKLIELIENVSGQEKINDEIKESLDKFKNVIDVTKDIDSFTIGNIAVVLKVLEYDFDLPELKQGILNYLTRLFEKGDNINRLQFYLCNGGEAILQLLDQDASDKKKEWFSKFNEGQQANLLKKADKYPNIKSVLENLLEESQLKRTAEIQKEQEQIKIAKQQKIEEKKKAKEAQRKTEEVARKVWDTMPPEQRTVIENMLRTQMALDWNSGNQMDEVKPEDQSEQEELSRAHTAQLTRDLANARKEVADLRKFNKDISRQLIELPRNQNKSRQNTPRPQQTREEKLKWTEFRQTQLKEEAELVKQLKILNYQDNRVAERLLRKLATATELRFEEMARSEELRTKIDKLEADSQLAQRHYCQQINELQDQIDLSQESFGQSAYLSDTIIIQRYEIASLREQYAVMCNENLILQSHLQQLSYFCNQEADLNANLEAIKQGAVLQFILQNQQLKEILEGFQQIKELSLVGSYVYGKVLKEMKVSSVVFTREPSDLDIHCLIVQETDLQTFAHEFKTKLIASELGAQYDFNQIDYFKGGCSIKLKPKEGSSLTPIDLSFRTAKKDGWMFNYERLRLTSIRQSTGFGNYDWDINNDNCEALNTADLINSINCYGVVINRLSQGFLKRYIAGSGIIAIPPQLFDAAATIDEFEDMFFVPAYKAFLEKSPGQFQDDILSTKPDDVKANIMKLYYKFVEKCTPSLSPKTPDAIMSAKILPLKGS
jgi:hypothetical protein